MKHFKYLSVLFVIAGLMFVSTSCSEEEDSNIPLTITTGALKNVTYNSAMCGGEITGGNDVGRRGVCWNTSGKPTLSDNYTTEGSGRGEFTCAITGLEEGCTYHVRAYVEHQGEIVYGEEKTCTTMAHGRPTIAFVGIADIAESRVTATANVITDGGVEISSRGFVYATSEDMLTTDRGTVVPIDGSIGEMKADITGLSDAQEYFICAYVSYGQKTVYTSADRFETPMYAMPTLSAEIGDLTMHSFKVTVNAAANTPLPIREYGIVMSDLPGPTLESSGSIKLGEGDGIASHTYDDLEDGKYFYVRPYAINKNGVSYGEQTPVSTYSQKACMKTVMTTLVTAHRALVGGRITSLGTENAAVQEVGVCWSTSHSPTTADSHMAAKEVPASTGEFEPLQLFLLKASTTYHVRTYAVNQYGTSYGDEYTFTTREPVSNYFTTSTDGEFFNGFNYTESTQYPTGEGFSADQKEAFQDLSKVLTAYNNRTLAGYRIYLSPDENGAIRYINTAAYYQNNAKNYSAIWKAKLDMDSDGVYSVSHTTTEGGNATSLLKSATSTGNLDNLYRSMKYLESRFVIDWDNESSTTVTANGKSAAFYIIPVDEPEKYKRMGVFRITGVKPYTDWW